MLSLRLTIHAHRQMKSPCSPHFSWKFDLETRRNTITCAVNVGCMTKKRITYPIANSRGIGGKLSIIPSIRKCTNVRLKMRQQLASSIQFQTTFSQSPIHDSWVMNNWILISGSHCSPDKPFCSRYSKYSSRYARTIKWNVWYCFNAIHHCIFPQQFELFLQLEGYFLLTLFDLPYC